MRPAVAAPFDQRVEPPIVGPAPRGRGWVTVPVAVALAALASSTPVVVAAVMVVVVLPMLATLGDMVAHRYRSDVGAAVRAWHRADARTVAPVFYVRNLLAGLLRSAPGLALGAVAVVVAAAVGDPHVDSGWRDLVVRLGGVGTVLCLLLPARAVAVASGRARASITSSPTWSMCGATYSHGSGRRDRVGGGRGAGAVAAPGAWPLRV